MSIGDKRMTSGTGHEGRLHVRTSTRERWYCSVRLPRSTLRASFGISVFPMAAASTVKPPSWMIVCAETTRTRPRMLVIATSKTSWVYESSSTHSLERQYSRAGASGTTWGSVHQGWHHPCSPPGVSQHTHSALQAHAHRRTAANDCVQGTAPTSPSAAHAPAAAAFGSMSSCCKNCLCAVANSARISCAHVTYTRARSEAQARARPGCRGKGGGLAPSPTTYSRPHLH